MSRATYEVAQVLEGNKESLATYSSNTWQLRTLHAIRKCRTSALGGHIDRCDHSSCNKLHLSYNSCRNRHCPKCQGHKQELWIRKREQELLNVPYYHVVFTLPDIINRLCLHRPKEVYTLLFTIAWSVIKDFSKNPTFLGAQTGMIAILHTWGQNLSLHPHLHCIVPGGGMTASGKWKEAKGKGKYLFPVKEMSNVFRARFVAELRKEFDQSACFYEALFKQQWVVYCKAPFYQNTQVVEYLGRYTHKIAISNHRILSLADGRVTFSAKDYRKGGVKYNLTLSDAEFIRRFCLHILPKGFTRIRHYGILSSSLKKKVLPLLRRQLSERPAVKNKQPIQHRRCPSCKKGILVTVHTFGSRGPPMNWIQRIESQHTTPKNNALVV